MSLATIDKLNVLYYGEMELSPAEKKLRIVMAGELQKIVRKYYDTVQAILVSPFSDDRRSLLLAAAVTSLKKAYLGFFDKFYEQYVNSIFRGGQPYYGVNSWRDKHALDFAVWLIKTARSEPNIAFAQSHSITVTRTEVNAVGNLAALDAAYRSGARFKTWETFGGGKVRPSHRAVGGTRIPIDEPFTVGGSKMMFPTDSSLGADASEIVNCRCTLKFDNGKSLTNANERGIINNNSLYRRSANSGAFSTLPERMSKAHIRELAEKYDIDIRGLTLNIDYNEELLRFRITGEAVPEHIGVVTFFPNAFVSEEQIIRTLYHEKQHVEQFRKYGAEYVMNNSMEFEKAAYAAEENFIEKLKKEGKL